MPTIRKTDGTIVEISFEQLVGEKREDGRFHVKLKDGSEGILMRKAELDKMEEERQREIRAGLDSLDAIPPGDPRPGLQQLFEDLNKK